MERKINERLTLSYPDPLVGVFLRVLAWEVFTNHEKYRSKEITTHLLKMVRSELGLKPLKGGASQEFINKLLKSGELKNMEDNYFKIPSDELWNSSSSWRLLNCPMHGATRKLSDLPVVRSLKISNVDYSVFNIALRNPAFDTIKIFVGKDKPNKGKILKKRGLYILGLEDGSLYIGQSTEFGTRSSSHFSSKKIKWWFFFSPTKINISKDTLDAAESLMISYWNEICYIHNHNRGSDQKPDFISLQQGILFAQSCSAIFIWFAREIKNNTTLQNEIFQKLLNDYFESDKELILFKKRKYFDSDTYLDPEKPYNSNQEVVDE